MADVENELKNLREKNKELVQKVQYLTMTAAKREKEINDLRLKISKKIKSFDSTTEFQTRSSIHKMLMQGEVSNNRRILKVLVEKMLLEDYMTDVSPPKRAKEETPPKSQRNYFTVLEAKNNKSEPGCSGVSKAETTNNSVELASKGRRRSMRPRKAVMYTEKPLNRKRRR